MRVVPIPQLADNYAWLIIGEGGDAAVVDPAEGASVLDAAAKEGVRIRALLATHHHADHVGGIEDLVRALPGVAVLGSATDAARIPCIDRRLEPDEIFSVAGLEGRLLAVPCHTRGHVAYLFGSALFSGDTLFAAGCGRFFEGTAVEMYRALYEVIGALPDDTSVYCGHEYTEANLRFAATVEPSNTHIRDKQAEARAQRAAGLPSVPTRLGEERRYNPFLRVRSAELIAAVTRATPGLDASDPVAVLGALRALKDGFR